MFLIFIMRTMFKAFVELVTILVCFMFWGFGHKACGILAPRPEIEPAPPPHTGRSSLNHWAASEFPNKYVLSH